MGMLRMWPGQMVNLLGKLGPRRKFLRGLLVVAVLVGCSVGAFCWGRLGGASQAAAQGTERRTLNDLLPGAGSDYERRVVAYLYGNVPITRAELGEYLIARFGAERLDFLVNRRIVEAECQAKGIQVTDAEVEAQLAADLRAMKNMTLKDFNNSVLKRFNKTLFEWKEDVLRPKLMMTKLCRPLVKVEKEDIEKAFEARYGPKVQCRMIVIQKGDPHRWKMHQEARQSEEGFTKLAKQQFIPNLASQGGVVPPVTKHFGDARLENAAFKLKVGEVSDLIEMLDGTYVILKCDSLIPPDRTKSIDSERLALMDEIFEAKLAQKIPEEFARLRRAAHPQLLLTPQQPALSETDQAAARELQGISAQQVGGTK